MKVWEFKVEANKLGLCSERESKWHLYDYIRAMTFAGRPPDNLLDLMYGLNPSIWRLFSRILCETLPCRTNNGEIAAWNMFMIFI